MLRKSLLLLSLLAMPVQAVELRDASNDQILAELEYRLRIGGGDGGRTFPATATCDFANLEVKIYDENFNLIALLDQYYQSQSNCQNMITALPFGASGRVEMGQQIAYCDHSDLEIYGVQTTGDLRLISDTYRGSTNTCQSEMREFNLRQGL